MALHTLALFAGAAGLELGLRGVVPSRTVCYVEREAYAAAVLVARMADGSLDEAPIWSDVTTFDGHPWRGAVDIVSGGFPCQDISVAGAGAGIDGDRSGLWSEYVRIVREVRPGFVFVENVAALASRGLHRVLGDLAAAGFDAEWGTLRASAVGAPHRRERLFIWAWRVSDTERGQVWPKQGRREPLRPGAPEPGHMGGERVEDAERAERWPSELAADERHRTDAGRHEATSGARGAGAALAYAEGDGWNEGRAECAGCGCLPAWPPGPGDEDGWQAYLAAGGPEPAVRRGSDGLAHRMDRLRLTGNGVVPEQAAEALRRLIG